MKALHGGGKLIGAGWLEMISIGLDMAPSCMLLNARRMHLHVDAGLETVRFEAPNWSHVGVGIGADGVSAVGEVWCRRYGWN